MPDEVREMKNLKFKMKNSNCGGMGGMGIGGVWDAMR
jgi:hypothetical protein